MPPDYNPTTEKCRGVIIRALLSTTRISELWKKICFLFTLKLALKFFFGLLSDLFLLWCFEMGMLWLCFQMFWMWNSDLLQYFFSTFFRFFISGEVFFWGCKYVKQFKTIEMILFVFNRIFVLILVPPVFAKNRITTFSLSCLHFFSVYN